MSDQISISKRKCLRCGHGWLLRQPREPAVCPKQVTLLEFWQRTKKGEANRETLGYRVQVSTRPLARAQKIEWVGGAGLVHNFMDIRFLLPWRATFLKRDPLITLRKVVAKSNMLDFNAIRLVQTFTREFTTGPPHSNMVRISAEVV